MIQVECHRCKALITQVAPVVVGCLCDPDAPTWVHITPDGRVIGLSHAKYTTRNIDENTTMDMS